MRHLGSIFLSLILAAGTYVLVGIGSSRIVEASIDDGGGVRHHPGAVAIGGFALLLAGALYTLLILPRLSPLGPVLAALALLGVQGWALFAPVNFDKTMQVSLLGAPRPLSFVAAAGLPLLFVVPMFATILSPRRWRGADRPAPATQFGGAPPSGYPSYPPYPPAPYSPAPTAYPPPPPPSAYGPPPFGVPAPVSGSPVPASPGATHAASDDETSATRPLYQPATPTYPPPPSFPPPPSYAPPPSNYPPPFPPAPTSPPPADPDTTRKL